jgi:hypothetical protein
MNRRREGRIDGRSARAAAAARSGLPSLPLPTMQLPPLRRVDSSPTIETAGTASGKTVPPLLMGMAQPTETTCPRAPS